jgi:hypothetical protein
MVDDSELQRSRHTRMPIRSTVLVCKGANAWASEIENISATGVLITRPEDWAGRAGDSCALDLLIGEDLHIHLEATVVRVTPHHVGLAYTHIPEDKEAALWSLLGRYADHLERPGS